MDLVVNLLWFACCMILLGADPIDHWFGIGVLSLWLYVLTLGAFKIHWKPTLRFDINTKAYFVLLPAWAMPYFTLMDWQQTWQTFPIPSIIGSSVGVASFYIYKLAQSKQKQT